MGGKEYTGDDQAGAPEGKNPFGLRKYILLRGFVLTGRGYWVRQIIFKVPIFAVIQIFFFDNIHVALIEESVYSPTG